MHEEDSNSAHEMAGRKNFEKVENYRAGEPDPLLRHNPMALVFTAPMSDDDMFDALSADQPVRPENFLNKPLEQRKERLELIDEFHNVFQGEVNLAQKIVALVRKSFRKRNPNNPRILNAIYRIMAGQEVRVPRQSESGAGGGLGLMLWGMTGIGKSSFLDRLVELLGDYGRIHQSLNGEKAQWPQLGVIRVTAQSTWKATLERVLSEVDRQLGRDFYLKRERSASTPRLERAVHSALTCGFAPLLIIDELQRLARLNETEALRILQGLIDMMGDWGIPVIVVGTVRVKHLLELYPSEMSKFTNGGTPQFLPLKAGDPDAAHFILLLKEYSISHTRIDYSPDFDFLLVSHCMGVRRIMREYMRVVLTRHAEDESTSVTGALIEDIAKTELERFEKSLSILRKSALGLRLNFDELQLYEDFLPPERAKKRKQTGAQIRVEAAWRSSNQTSLIDDYSPDVTAKEFLQLRKKLGEEEAADREFAVQEKAEKESTAATKSERHAPDSNSNSKSKRTRKASKQINQASKAVAIGVRKGRNEAELQGVDPSGVS